jgi:hypothetical protein
MTRKWQWKYKLACFKTRIALWVSSHLKYH